ncbi:MAG: MoaD/ThiS family protein [Nitrospinae bacterium]|nr:MoaD/ThiS family protein [Nitrospinota bacterium]
MVNMIKVLYFASVKEKLGLGSEAFEYKNGLTLSLLITRISEKHPELRTLTATKRFLYAVNQEVSDLSSTLKDGDEVAILPPLSGGN